ncbi:MBL fold metallo-hydrolase [Desulforamulus aeronauticus]|uniref:Glyoxylase, beta-lactamase superfamily II n=1 Tax=Desulforamulus aeronauticus DSM 10349 TaxID=1121421 RepID=A0A1M6TEL4_9FIRM|nr:MBL fold metallo-hydrolase [Desulforamulus aeronauticus]SHK55329.1 Glyoxylase, beta-lactamase superfamily II [Desulforamulus aeronauticus DSM 10349]
MKIAAGVEMLEITANIMGKQSIISPTLLWDNDTVILVDAGYPGQLQQFREAIEQVGLPFDKLTMIILTHHDIDHIGSLVSINQALPQGVRVLAHEEEKPYIQGEKCPVKLAQLGAKLDSLTPEMKVVYENLKAGFEKCKAPVDQTVTDGEVLPYCGGITVIDTPGHTPGHICLYLKESKVLLAGDALGVENGQLVASPKFINFDNALSIKSLAKLTHYDIETVICYHGGLYTDKVGQRIKELAKEPY